MQIGWCQRLINGAALSKSGGELQLHICKDWNWQSQGTSTWVMQACMHAGGCLSADLVDVAPQAVLGAVAGEPVQQKVFESHTQPNNTNIEEQEQLQITPGILSTTQHPHMGFC